MKKLPAICLALILGVAMSVPAYACPGPEIVTTPYNDSMCYTTSASGVTIYGCDGASGHLEIPSEIDGLPVVKIADRAFTGNKAITSLSLPKTIQGIGEYAFSGCTNITGALILPESGVSLGPGAFQGLGITSLVLSGGGMYFDTFWGCTKLEKIYVGLPREVWAHCLDEDDPLQKGPGNQAECFNNAKTYYVYEDPNGDINFDDTTNMADAFRVYHTAAGKSTVEWYERAVADFNSDSKLDMVDAMTLYAQTAGKA